MRFRRNRKGQVRVIEAFFASLLLMACMALIPQSPTQQTSAADLSPTAQNILVSLDSNGHLAGLIENGDWQGLKSCVESSVPLTVWFNLTVYDSSMNPLNSYPISNGGVVSDKISSYDYVCVSQSGNYTIYILRLQLAGID